MSDFEIESSSSSKYSAACATIPGGSATGDGAIDPLLVGGRVVGTSVGTIVGFTLGMAVGLHSAAMCM